MKKSAPSINNNRDINLSQRKRMRSSTPAREEDDRMNDGSDESRTGLSRKKVKHVVGENSKENNQAGHSTTIASTASGSSISFSSSSKAKCAAAANNSKATQGKSNPSAEFKEKKLYGKEVIGNNSVVSKEK